ADLRGQFAGGDPRDVAPAHPHRAARAGPHPGDRLGQGGLARAVAADDGEEVVLGNVHLHPVQGEAVAAPDGEPADLDGGGGDGGGGRAGRPKVCLGGRGGGSRVRIARFPLLLRPGRFEGRGRIPGGGVVFSPGGGRGRTRNRGGALLFPGGGGGQVRGRGGGGGELLGGERERGERRAGGGEAAGGQYRGGQPDAEFVELRGVLGEDGARRALQEEGAVGVEHRDPVDQVDGVVQVVLDQHDGAGPVGGEGAEQRVQLPGAGRVEVGGGLVEHQQPGAHGQGAGQGEPLPAAAG